MAAYVIADVNVTNPELFKKYSEQVPATVEQYGGKYLIRGGEVEKADITEAVAVSLCDARPAFIGLLSARAVRDFLDTSGQCTFSWRRQAWWGTMWTTLGLRYNSGL